MIIGVDVGGTFTDLALWDGAEVRSAKVPTTPDQSEAVVAGTRGLTDQPLDGFLHGTTVATNALLERRGARTALLTTAGFGDVIEIARQDRPSLYDPFDDRPEPLVARNDRHEIASADTVDAEMLDGVEAVAVALLHAYANPAVEDAVLDRIGRLLPGLPVSLSSRVVAEFREYERSSTTVLNAYLTPVTAEYLARLEERVIAGGFAPAVGVMRSSGGLIAATEAARLPASVLLSGPAGGVVAAAALGAAEGRKSMISFDMGGTSTDVCRIEDGAPEVFYERSVAGYPCRMPSTAIHTVGAGGGSVGWVDAGGSLRVGPRSAGADPGPACYGRGGVEATVTDAHVFLGRIAPEAALGGALRVDSAAARAAVGALGDAAGLDTESGAIGIVRVVEEVMAGAIRTVSIQQGQDPRDATLVAFGGAGGLHATSLARSLDMAGVLIPSEGGVFSALGLLLSPPRADASRSVLLDGLELSGLDAAIAEVGVEAASRSTEAGSPGGEVATRADVRYRGQSHEITVAYTRGEGGKTLAARFHAAHLERNGFSRIDDPIEVVTVRAEAVGRAALAFDDIVPTASTGAAARGYREILTSAGPVNAGVFRRRGLGPGDEVVGPAAIEERDAATFIGPGERAVVLDSGALEVTW